MKTDIDPRSVPVWLRPLLPTSYLNSASTSTPSRATFSETSKEGGMEARYAVGGLVAIRVGTNATKLPVKVFAVDVHDDPQEIIYNLRSEDGKLIFPGVEECEIEEVV